MRGQFSRGIILDPTRVPTCQVELITTHPLACGAQSLWLPNVNGIDLGPRGLTLTSIGSPPTIASAIGPVAALNGTSQYFSAPAASYNFATGTIAWLQNPSTAYNSGTIRGIWGSNTVGLCAQLFNDNKFYVGWNASGDQRVILSATSAMWSTGVWSAYVFTWSSSGCALYSNGVLLGTSAAPNLSATTSNFLVGSYYNASPTLTLFAGGMSNLAIFSVAWTQAQVVQFAAEPFSMLRPIVRRQYYKTLSGSAWSAIFMAPTLSGSSNLGKTARSGLVLSTDIDAALAVAKVARAAQAQTSDIDATSAIARTGRGGMTMSSDTDTTYGIAKIGRGGMANSADVGAQTAAAKVGRAGAVAVGGISATPALGRVARVAKAIGGGISALYAAASKASVGGHPASVLFSSLSVFGVAAKAARSSVAETLAISTTSAAGKSARVGKSQSVDISSASAIGASRSDNTQAQAQVWIM